MVDAERKRMRDPAGPVEGGNPQATDQDWKKPRSDGEARHKAGIEWFQFRAKEHHDLDLQELRSSLTEVEGKGS